MIDLVTEGWRATYAGPRRWLRGLDLNQRPLGYEPNELPDCSTPHWQYNQSVRSCQPLFHPNSCGVQTAGSSPSHCFHKLNLAFSGGQMYVTGRPVNENRNSK